MKAKLCIPMSLMMLAFMPLQAMEKDNEGFKKLVNEQFETSNEVSGSEEQTQVSTGEKDESEQFSEGEDPKELQEQQPVVPEKTPESEVVKEEKEDETNTPEPQQETPNSEPEIQEPKTKEKKQVVDQSSGGVSSAHSATPNQTPNQPSQQQQESPPNQTSESNPSTGKSSNGQMSDFFTWLFTPYKTITGCEGRTVKLTRDHMLEYMKKGYLKKTFGDGSAQNTWQSFRAWLHMFPHRHNYVGNFMFYVGIPAGITAAVVGTILACKKQCGVRSGDDDSDEFDTEDDEQGTDSDDINGEEAE